RRRSGRFRRVACGPGWQRQGQCDGDPPALRGRKHESTFEQGNGTRDDEAMAMSSSSPRAGVIARSAACELSWRTVNMQNSLLLTILLQPGRDLLPELRLDDGAEMVAIPDLDHRPIRPHSL